MLSSPTPHGIRRIALVAVTSLGLILTLAACSGGTGAGSEDDGLGTSATFEDWNIDYQACLTAEGIDPGATVWAGEDAPDDASGPGANMVSEDVFLTARQKCITKLGEPPVQEDAPSDEEMDDMMLTFAKCMRAAGYDYPDPSPGSGGMAPAIAVDETSAADVDACSIEAGLSK